jgi:hypothetical protein
MIGPMCKGLGRADYNRHACRDAPGMQEFTGDRAAQGRGLAFTIGNPGSHILVTRRCRTLSYTTMADKLTDFLPQNRFNSIACARIGDPQHRGIPPFQGWRQFTVPRQYEHPPLFNSSGEIS